MGDDTMGPVMVDFIRQNVDLIKTIPPRFHTAIHKRLVELQRRAPFDQSQVRRMFYREFKSSGYNLRRLTRDQTNKAVGQLNLVRQKEAGVEKYRWRTAADERVRPTHHANSARIFFWDQPPPETGHPGEDIQCRCVASAHLPRRETLEGLTKMFCMPNRR